ncbi:MAG: amidohydrolase [Acidobacteriota bacterium]
MLTVLRPVLALFALGPLLLVAACRTEAPTDDPVDTPTTLFVGGTILTLDDPPVVDALAVRGERIVGLGERTELESRFPDAMQIDLEGRALLPGFVDSHTHVHELGRDRLLADLTGTASVAEMIARLRARYPEPEPGTWLIGQGWDEGEWGSRGYPDRAELDAAFPDHPVWLHSLHGFAGFGNALALDRAGIDAATADPEGGTILRRADGEATGVLLTLAQGLVRRQIPADTPDMTRQAILAGLRQLAAAGVTTVHEAGLSPSLVDAYSRLAADGALPIRVYGLLDGNDDALVDTWIERGPAPHGSTLDPTGYWTVRGFKVFYDGSLGSRTALLAEPYADVPETARPTERISPDRVRRLAERAAAAGFQMAVHTIGDEGNRRILELYEEVLAEHPGLDHRWRFEHAQVVTPDFYGRAAAIHAIASMQPSHAVGDSGWAEERVGAERVLHAYAWRRMLDAGVPLVFNSDLPGEPWRPLETLYFAVTRRRLGDPEGGGWYADQATDVDETLHAMTVAGAHAGFDDDRLGRLAPGLLADLVELEADPRTVEPNRLPALAIGRVWVGGRLVDAP